MPAQSNQKNSFEITVLIMMGSVEIIQKTSTIQR